MSELDLWSWPELVGYQHEVVHTGVMRYLLSSEHAVRVASGMLGGIDIAGVRDPRPERRIETSKRVTDLAAVLDLPDGRTVNLGVETKVDSNARGAQLKEELTEPDHGILLAVGLTAFSLTQADVKAQMLPGWTAVNPERWKHVLEAAEAERDPLLRPYLEMIRTEAKHHAAAREHVRIHDLSVAYTGRHRKGRTLEHFAWLSELRSELQAPENCWTTTERSGPQMAFWSEDLQLAKEEGYAYDTFLSLMCSDRKRILCLKLGKLAGNDPARVAERVLPTLQATGWEPNPQLRPSRDTCTIATLDLSRHAAPEAGEQMQVAISALAQHAPSRGNAA